MKVLLVGGSSSLALAVRTALPSSIDVVSGGRHGCDVQLDLMSPAEELLIPSVDTVINCAANFGGTAAPQMLAAEDVNVLGVLKLAQACFLGGASHFLSVSSIFATLNSGSPFFNVYALSKRHSDELLQLYCRQAGMPLTILRPGQFYGEWDSFRMHQPLIYSFLDKAESGEEIVINGNNDALRNFVYVDDVAQVIVRIIERAVLGTYNCCALRNVRFSQIAERAVEAVGSQSEIRFDRSKPDIPDNGFDADNTLFQAIDFQPKVSLSEGFQKIVARRRLVS
ncbi:NAD-dependent epimerase/dehydratase family protein [Luminiphilus sp. nBUS_16]|uniref:NAD-dependent epimerase/dehydratase family protein n=1 Tax=Luminiphilus sp. nBUS_16 TaxID=3395315 RepID=UPI003EB8373A